MYRLTPFAFIKTAQLNKKRQTSLNNLLNHKILVESMYNKKCTKYTSLIELNNYVDKLHAIKYIEHPKYLINCFINDVNKYKIISNITRNMKKSNGEQHILDILIQFKKVYQMYYFHSHHFPFCKNVKMYEFDFWCLLIKNNRVIQFVIEYDGCFHFENNNKNLLSKQHYNDILKQYYLKQLNIHLLRINYKLPLFLICETICNFVKTIINTETYIINDKIELDLQKLKTISLNKGYDIFIQNYYLNNIQIK